MKTVEKKLKIHLSHCVYTLVHTAGNYYLYSFVFFLVFFLLIRRCSLRMLVKFATTVANTVT